MTARSLVATIVLCGTLIMPATTSAAMTQASASRLYVPILTYHHIAERATHNPYFVSPEMFAEQMAWLKKNNYHVITYAQFYDAMTKGTELPDKPVVLTFDDGHRDQFLNAVPVLEKYGFSGMFYIVGGYVDRTTSVTWDMLKQMVAAHMEIGAHSMSHPNLTKLNAHDLQFEVAGSKKILEQHLGIPVNFFAYPGGALNARVVHAVKAVKFLSAVSVRHDVYHPKNENLFTVARMHIDNDMESFEGFVTGARMR